MTEVGRENRKALFTWRLHSPVLVGASDSFVPTLPSLSVSDHIHTHATHIEAL